MDNFISILGTIYLFQKLYEPQPQTIKIGSTMNFINRMCNYLTAERYFNNESLKIWKLKITRSKYNCYELDKIIQYTSKKYQQPYNYFFEGDGGLEHYHFTDISNICNYFDIIDVKYEFEEIDVDKLREEMKKVHHSDIIKTFIEDMNKHNDILLSNELKNKLNEIFTKKDVEEFSLWKFQQEIFDLVKSSIKRLFHLIIAPTGTGKTLTFTTILLYKMLKTKKDIMIITKRKEILTQMIKKIPENIEKIKNSKIVNIDFEPTDQNIINCLHNCNIKKLNKKNDTPCVYIVNFDKFTNIKSKLHDYDKINFNKFGMVIIDESHWVGATEINKLMIHIRENSNTDVLGFSATPLRCNKINRELTEKLFSKDNVEFENTSIYDDINVLHEYSYYDALKDKIICPIKWIPLIVQEKDFIDDEVIDDIDTDEDSVTSMTKKYKSLHISAFKKVWEQLKINIISKSFKKKGILWFRQRKDLLTFYKQMSQELKQEFGENIYCTMSYAKGEEYISKLVNDCKLDSDHFDDEIKNFEKCENNGLLLSVFRAIEGFDENKIDFGVRMYYSNSVDAVTETQRMGRMNRTCKGKAIGYFATLELETDLETMKKNIIMRLKNWIAFARSYTNNGKKIDKFELNEQLKEIMNTYIDADIVKIYNIDIENEIIKDHESKSEEYKNMKIYTQKNNIKTKQEYIKKSHNDKNLIKSPEEYFEKYWNGWYNYLNIDTNNFIKDKNEWKNKCKKLKVTSLENYHEKCKFYNELPLYPNEIYYNFTSIENELNLYDIDTYF
ncbi:DEXDc helicase [Bodo saltans virus]|uniref:DEXDc helicase n=1 Tax=Bodo saltans virus TaxID=2024608 RepID=A0A2H4UVX6_9VIRU|nr:DEXDc helicase [Bodo saltans virus]ATZ81083.1 DEXDc helicase [Bodo saltans virus]